MCAQISNKSESTKASKKASESSPTWNPNSQHALAVVGI